MPKYLLLSLSFLLFFGCSSDDSPGTNDPNNPRDGGALTAVTPCSNGMAGIYPCDGYDFIGRIELSVFDAQSGNDSWGWTDSTTGKEYALMGLDNGTAFVDISDEENLIYLGKLPSAGPPTSWRDIKVFEDHAFIVSESVDMECKFLI